ncbi:MAG: hypothetical protein PUB32_04335 [Clostridiales bacterium]|nr:hypothetical protein [Clostridiales bacterium]
MDQKEKKQNHGGQKLYLSLLLALIAFVSVVAASVAWFTIADHTRLHSIGMNVTSGPAIRFELDAHNDISEYKRTLTFQEIADRILEERGYDMRTQPLEPVTTRDCVEFTLRNGAVVSADSGSYLEFTLHFIATQDVVVHLTSENSSGGNDGTLVSSKTQETLPEAMRISFTADGETVIFDPGMGDQSQTVDGLRTFGLPDANHMVYTDINTLFTLQREVDKPVIIRIWMEGTDPACDNSLQGVDYSIRLRFEATDASHNRISSEPDA